MFLFRVQRFGLREGIVGRILIACMVLGFAALIVAGLAAAWLTARNQDHTRWVNHTYDVEIAIAEVSILIEQGEASRRGFLLTRQPTYLNIYTGVARDMPVALGRLRALTTDNPSQQASIAQLEQHFAILKAQRDRTIALARSGRLDAARRAFADEPVLKLMIKLRDLSKTMREREKGLLILRDGQQRNSIRLFYGTLALAGVILLIVALASLITVLRHTRDLATSRDRLRDFADELEDLVEERTADLTRANEEIQRFAYIVSHDLRSPLVNVMGFTAELDTATAAIADLIDRAEQAAPEIVTAAARTAAREDLPEAIGFIRTSTQKMDRLINAILKLSREGRRVITPELIDVTALIATIDGSLKHLTEERGAVIETEGTLPGIVTDRLAIEQIFSNLIENAVKYLQPGRPGRVIVRGSQTGSRIAYEIEDNGRGIAASDHQRVFDLFRRSGAQDQSGEGIGLAHVRALAYRLGGVIDVHSELGKGATFRLTLPASLAETTIAGPNAQEPENRHE